MNIFVSYASEHVATAEEIALALREERHDVFLDRSALPEGDAYNAEIREAIERCDLIVFLLSPESVAAGRYTLTELAFAEDKWSSPVGHLLPVVVSPTEKSAIPAYLRAVVILQPKGNVAAEVVAAVDRLAKPRWMRLVRRLAAVFVPLLVLGGGYGGWRAYEHWRACGDASSLIKQAELERSTGEYAIAWDRYADAAALCPGPDEIARGRERLAMEWLDNIQVAEGVETYTDVVGKVHRALSEAAVGTDTRRSADALAHLGWADFLRTRDRVPGLDPVRYYKEAIARDPENPFAHAMWAHFLMWHGGAIDDAKVHFAHALESGRERPYVRRMQLAAFQLHSVSPPQDELIRVLNEMRSQGESLPPGDEHDSQRWRTWNVYYERLYTWSDRPDFLAAIPSKDHLATFRWLFPDNVMPSDKRPLHQFMLAQLLENDGDRAGALTAYETLMTTLASQKWESMMTAKSREAIRRLKG